MSIETPTSTSLRATIAAHRDAIEDILGRYHASNPWIFGSVARGEATEASDIDLMVDLDPTGGNPLLRVAGLAEELSDLLGTRVEVVTAELLRGPVSEAVLVDAVAV